MSQHTSFLVKIRVSLGLSALAVKQDLLEERHLDSSEYSAACDERRAYISGFNGSAGTC